MGTPVSMDLQAHPEGPLKTARAKAIGITLGTTFRRHELDYKIAHEIAQRMGPRKLPQNGPETVPQNRPQTVPQKRRGTTKMLPNGRPLATQGRPVTITSPTKTFLWQFLCLTPVFFVAVFVAGFAAGFVAGFVSAFAPPFLVHFLAQLVHHFAASTVAPFVKSLRHSVLMYGNPASVPWCFARL